MMKKTVVFLLAFTLSTLAFGEDQKKDTSKAEDRIQAAATVLNEIESAPDTGIPEEVLGSAECVAVVPSLLKGGFIVGADYGRGVASCRTEKGWSAPAFLFTSGGSVGFQIGGQAIDLVMLIMNKDGAEKLLSSKFKLGADASVAAGPVGRHAEADTDWKLRAQVLTYSRSRGVFAGISLAGAVIKQDKDATREFYGRMVPFRTSLTGKVESPHGAYPFLDTLAKWAKKAADKDKPAESPKPAEPAKPSEPAKSGETTH
jgi:lipid-binding SYLF domain-containing protein